MEGKKGQTVLEIARDTKPGVLTGIDKVFSQNAYPVTAVVYGPYPIRDPDPTNLAVLRHGDLLCRSTGSGVFPGRFEGRGANEGLTSARRQKIREWEERVHETGASVYDVAGLETIYHSEGRRRRGHLQQRQISAQQM